MSNHLIKNSAHLDKVVRSLLVRDFLSIDTETYGVDFNDPAFSIQICDGEDAYYINMNPIHEDNGYMHPIDVSIAIKPLMDKKDVTWFIHNAKFDMRRMDIMKCPIQGLIHCTQTMERFVNNQLIKYDLDSCLRRRGMKKDDAVKNYIKENKLYAHVAQEGKKTKVKKVYYNEVPFDIMFNYGLMDAVGCYELGMHQHSILSSEQFYQNELKLQRTAYDMEKIGMAIRREYATAGYEYEMKMADKIRDELSRLAGREFVSGPKWLKEIFDLHMVPYETNPKTGNAVFDKDALDKINHPIAQQIRKFRRHEKYATTYYATYKQVDVLHPIIKLAGTDTGRLSYSNPNIQNVPKEEELDEAIPYQVRGCYQPRPDYCFVMIDYDQQEFRMFLDYAGELELIRRIRDEGIDVHQATADMIGITRKQAKTINFGLLYGMGSKTLAASLKVSELDAKILMEQYFSSLPNVRRTVANIIATAEKRKWIKTWTGRRLAFPIKDYAYKAPNHLIQGGCADIARIAMVLTSERLEGMKSRLVLQVHDELVFEIHKDEVDIVPELRTIMENIYRPFNGMNLTCGVDHSWVSWGKRDVHKGSPIPKEG